MPTSAKLTARILIEGAPGAGVATVIGDLAQQVFATISRSPARLDNERKLSLVTFDSGQYGGAPIRVEVVSLGEQVSAAHGTARRAVDALLLVIEPTTAGVAAADRRLADIDVDLSVVAPERRANVILIAHQQDRRDALSPLQILSLLQRDLAIAPTSRDFGGMQFAVAMALRDIVDRVEVRDRAGVLRRMPSTASLLFDEFAPMIKAARPTAVSGAPPSPVQADVLRALASIDEQISASPLVPPAGHALVPPAGQPLVPPAGVPPVQLPPGSPFPPPPPPKKRGRAALQQAAEAASLPLPLPLPDLTTFVGNPSSTQA